MKQIKLIIAMVLITVLFALSVNAGFQTVFNPFTGKLDYTRNTNWTENVSFGANVSVAGDLLIGGGYGNTGTTLYSNGDIFSNGDFIIKDIINVSDINASGDIIPALTDTFTLGNSSNVWKNVFVGQGVVGVPSMAFGDGDSGLVELADDNISIVNVGVETMLWSNETPQITIQNNAIFASTNAAGTGIINMFGVDTGDNINIFGNLKIGDLELTKDQLNVFVDMPVTSSASAGTEVGYVFAIDGTTFIQMNTSSNGAGGINVPLVSMERTTASPVTLVEILDFGNFSIAHNTTHGCLVSDSGNSVCVET